MSNRLKGGMCSVVIGFAKSTALAITVASLVESKSNAFLFVSRSSTLTFSISTVG